MLEKVKKAILISFLGLFFLTPLVWTPINFELFEFSKIVLVYFFASLIVFLWVVRMILERRLIFRKTALFWPLILFFISQLLSTLFSIDPHTSLYGYYSRFYGGLLSIISCLALYFALVSNGERNWLEKIIKTSLFSGLLVSAYGIAEHFGIDKNIWVQDVQRRVFSTLGQPNWLAAYLDVLLIASLSLFLFIKNPKQKKLLGFVFFNYYLCLLYTKSKSGFLGFSFGLLFFLLIFLSFEIKKVSQGFKKIVSPLFFPAVVVIGLSLFVGTPFSPSLPSVLAGTVEKIKEGGLGAELMVDQQAETSNLNITPSGEIRKIVWQGAVDLWKQKPIFGTGVETFAYSYYWVRPAKHNLTSEWDFLYNKAHNEYLNFAATSGTVGLLSYLSIIVVFFYFSLKKIYTRKEKMDIFLVSCLCCLTTILVTNFFGFSVVIIGIAFFLIPGLADIHLSKERKEKNQQFTPDRKTKAVLLLVVFLFLLVSVRIVNYWRADLFFAKGKSLEAVGNYKASYDYLKKAVKLNRSEPVFYSQLSLTLADLGYLSFQSDLDEQGQQMVDEAVKASDVALSVSPYHLNFYKDRARMFYLLSKTDPEYLKNSLESLLSAIILAPSDAKLYYNAGLMYQAIGENQKAVDYLKKSISLKPNYDQAIFWLDQIKLE
jgi:putative inorganic carbon (hco3(-)) transporter